MIVPLSGPFAHGPRMATTDSGMSPANQSTRTFVDMINKITRYKGHFVHAVVGDCTMGGGTGPWKPIIGWGIYAGYMFMLCLL